MLALVSFARVSVLFLESLAVVRDERNADNELLLLCRREAGANASPKFRNACLDAHADRASPLVLKAIVRAVYTAWGEFSTSVSTPFGFFTVLLFFLGSLVLPLAPWLKLLFAAATTDDAPASDGHVIVLANGDRDHLPRGGVRRRMRTLLRGRSASCVETPPLLNELDTQCLSLEI